MDLYEKIKGNPHNVSPSQLIELLESYGFVLRGKSGDHFQYKKEGLRTFPVPIRQKPLSVHIVKNALRLIGEIRDK